MNLIHDAPEADPVAAAGGVPAGVLAHLADGAVLAFELDFKPRMLKEHLHDLGGARRSSRHTSIKFRKNLLENPRIATSSSPDHETVTAGNLVHFFNIRSTAQVSIADNRNGDFFFYLADDIPVSQTAVVLLTGPAVDSDSRAAGFLNHMGDFRRIYMLRINPRTDFNSHRAVGSFNKRRDYFSNKDGTSHKSGTVAVVKDLRYRTAHIHIEDIIRDIFDDMGSLDHRVHIRAEKLKRDRMLVRSNLKKLPGIFIVVADGLGTYHFHADKTSAHFVADAPEGQVSNTRHWREDKRVGKLYVSNR